MKKKIVAMMLIGMMSVSMAACGGEENSSKEDDVKVEEKEEVKEPTDLTGTWKSENNDGAWQEAIITENTIEINWISDNGDTKSLYWAGTYDAPTEYVEEYS